MSVDLKEPRARVVANKAAWRLIALATFIVLICLAAALIAQVGLGSDEGVSTDPLTTVTLVLAILAFLIQIFVFVFQTNASTSSVVRSEELNSQTRGVLEKIEANSSATQKVLFAQFDRLLDYVVDGKPARPLRPPERGPGVEDETADPAAPASKRDLARAINEAVARATERPSFPLEGADPESAAMIEYLRGWSTLEEAKEQVSVLATLSPLALATFVRFGAAEIEQREERNYSGLWVAKQDMDPATEELLAANLLRHYDTFIRLTDEGRAAWRALPFMKRDDSPEWLTDVLEPLLKKPQS